MTATIERWVPAKGYYSRSAQWWKGRTVRVVGYLNGPKGRIADGVTLEVLGKSQGLIVWPTNDPGSLMKVQPSAVEVKLIEGEKAKE